MGNINKKRFSKIIAGVLALILAVSGGQVSAQAAAQDTSDVGIEFVGDLVVRFWTNQSTSDVMFHSVSVPLNGTVGQARMPGQPGQPDMPLPELDFRFVNWYLSRNGGTLFSPDLAIDRITDVYAVWAHVDPGGHVPDPIPSPQPSPEIDPPLPPPGGSTDPGGETPTSSPEPSPVPSPSPEPEGEPEPPELEPEPEPELEPEPEPEPEGPEPPEGPQPPPTNVSPPSEGGFPPGAPGGGEEPPPGPGGDGGTGTVPDGAAEFPSTPGVSLVGITAEIETIELIEEITEIEAEATQYAEEPESWEPLQGEQQELIAMDDPGVPLVRAEPSPAESPDEPYMVEIGGLRIPLAAPPGFNAWALLNLILSILGVALAIVTFKRYRTQRKWEQEEEDALKEELYLREGIIEDEEMGVTVALSEEELDELATLETGDEIDERKRTKWVWPAGVGIVSVAAIILFVLTQDMSLPWVLVDRWTIVHAIMFAAQIAALYVMFKKRDEEEEDEDGEIPEDSDDLDTGVLA